MAVEAQRPTVADMDAIMAEGLTKRYGTAVAVDNIDVRLGAGSTLAVLGPNGAGKTTTVGMLTGQTRRNGGVLSVLGTDPSRAGSRWRARIGVVPQASQAFSLLTPKEILGHLRVFYPNPLPVAEVITRLDLGDQADQRIATLSGGQRRRVDVACAIIGRPELLFLDEPTTGLDPVARRSLWSLLADLRDLGTATLLTSHMLDEVEALADDVVVLAGGRVIARGTPSTLGGRSGGVEVSFAAVGMEDPPPRVVEEGTVERRGDRIVITTQRATATVGRVARWARTTYGLDEVPSLTVTPCSLEDAYLRMLDGAPAAPLATPLASAAVSARSTAAAGSVLR